MRRTLPISCLVLLACGGTQPDSPTRHTGQQNLVCSGSDVPIYRNRFAPQSGASGVATAPEAAAGIISSDAASAVGVGAPSFVAGGDSAARTDAPVVIGPTPPLTSASAPDAAGPGSSGGATGATMTTGSAAPITAMDTTCGRAACVPGQVAVEIPPAAAGPGAVTSGAPAVRVAAEAPRPSSPAAAESTTGVTTSALTAPAPAASASTFFCTTSPPICPEGQSPQFTSKRTWECTDCSLVVTYGGAYGNYRRCVNMPHLVCPAGEVPTWVFEKEQWECDVKCDNGLYDQHTVEGLLVCVPC
jgi:hypothetical protein